MRTARISITMPAGGAIKAKNVQINWAGRFHPSPQLESEVRNYVTSNPQKHLRGIPNVGFERWQADTRVLLFLPVEVKDEAAQRWHTVLAVIELGERKKEINQYPCWIILDGEGKMIGLFEYKVGTLPAAYIQREDLYEELARFTYRISDIGIDAADRKKKARIPWIDGAKTIFIGEEFKG